ncbi:MAG: SAM-dependent methyltransferase [Pseudomonadota bacterium]
MPSAVRAMPPQPETAPLAQRLARRVAATGPLTLAEYMAECLLDPTHGYYTTRDPLGAAGDFTTAPEISQMFGELVGLALAQAWLDQGAPEPITLAELGPGRGTLMADLLRATRTVPGFAAAARVHLVERSPTLRAAQAERLPASTQWHNDVADLPENRPLFLVANEFFDALPIRQFRRDAQGWREVMITHHSAGFAFALSPPAPIAALDHRLADTAPGDIVELCPALPASVTEIARRLSHRGGCAFLIDYGGWRARGDTFQAVRAHERADPLAAPGTADLTAHVDFEAIARAARAAGAAAWGPAPQGAWLGALGIAARSDALARGIANATQRAAHEAAFRRLTAPDQMGTVFKVAALNAPDDPAPAGLVPAPETPPLADAARPNRRA